MCEQCSANTETWSINKKTGESEEILPGVILVRARRTGLLMEDGDWGLVRCNDPDVWWGVGPGKDPVPASIELGSRLAMPPEVGYEYIVKANQRGFDKTDDTFAIWLYELFSQWVETHRPETDEESLVRKISPAWI